MIDKYHKEKYESNVNEDNHRRTCTEYTVVINSDAVKKKKIVEIDSRWPMYEYLSVGDRVRFHPNFGTYEKYDKSKDSIIYCNVCTVKNPIQNDRCEKIQLEIDFLTC